MDYNESIDKFLLIEHRLMIEAKGYLDIGHSPNTEVQAYVYDTDQPDGDQFIISDVEELDNGTELDDFHMENGGGYYTSGRVDHTKKKISLATLPPNHNRYNPRVDTRVRNILKRKFPRYEIVEF